MKNGGKNKSVAFYNFGQCKNTAVSGSVPASEV